MAKGNMLLGYSRGSVGDVTFYRSGGSQRQRARNRQPNNPRTARQMAQRSVFANAVKFFKQFNSGFFRFAYEDKKTNESDYNAFMRHNVENSGYIGARASKIADFPALGLWQITAGSLPEIAAPFPQPTQIDGLYFDMGVTFSDETYDTIGKISSALINGNPSRYHTGDIITICVYRATNASVLPTVFTDLGNSANAGYMQFILNTSDTSPRSSIEINLNGVTARIDVDSGGLSITGIDEAWATAWEYDLFGIAVIHSRNTATGLKVSNSTMAYNKTDKVISAMSDSGEYYNEVLSDWQASAEAILQGGGSSQYVGNPDVVGTYAYNLTEQIWRVSALGERLHHTGTTETILLKCVDGQEINAEDFRAVGYSSVFTIDKYQGEHNPPADSYLLSFTLPSEFSGDISIYYKDKLICTFY